MEEIAVLYDRGRDLTSSFQKYTEWVYSWALVFMEVSFSLVAQGRKKDFFFFKKAAYTSTRKRFLVRTGPELSKANARCRGQLWALALLNSGVGFTEHYCFTTEICTDDFVVEGKKFPWKESLFPWKERLINPLMYTTHTQTGSESPAVMHT